MSPLFVYKKSLCAFYNIHPYDVAPHVASQVAEGDA